MSSQVSLYDSVPYPSLAFLQTHPDRLAVMGTLHGMNPPVVGHCRVLEMGCGDGSNLIPMAYGLPGSRFVGVDLAAKPVEFAQNRISRLDLSNIQIEQLDLMEIGADFGTFDYIIAHGVYAWVPEPVQKKILEICSANLSANGVAFVSYNTGPAGNVRQALREMMQFHERRSSLSSGISGNRVRSGRHFLESVLKASDARTPWKALFQDELKLMFQRDEKVVYHDDLAESFSPALFGDFMERAGDCGLQFLSEAPLIELLPPELGAESIAALNEFAGDDLIAQQQYLDFAKYRRFRQTLLCRDEVILRRDEMRERARGLLVASPMRASAELPDGAVEFTNSRGHGTLATNNPVIIAVLRRLEQIWPQAERFEELISAVRDLMPEAQQTESVDGLAESMFKLAANQLADLRTYQLPLAAGVSDKPTASLLARLMVQEETTVTTLLHTHINVEDELGRRFLQLLDGTRDRHALVDALAAECANDSRETILKQVDENLVKSYRMGLLEA
jgi:methyltransferase-like protein/protein-L-isoaspartate O-methyltransferase